MGIGKQLPILFLASGLCLGQGLDSALVTGPAASLAHAEAPERPGVSDLDFANDFSPPAEPAQPPPIPADSTFLGAVTRPWVFWTLGASAAAAGGMAWFLHSYLDATPAVQRTEQVFTDEQ